MSDTGIDPQYGAPLGARIAPRVSKVDSSFDRAEQARFDRIKNGMFPTIENGVGPGQVDNYIRSKYPYLAAFLDHPEIGPILRRAAVEKWGENELYGALQPTAWWQSTSAAARTWDSLVSQDPAEAARQAGQNAANIANRARSLGLNMSQDAIESLASIATRNKWTDNQIVDKLLGSLNWATVSGGDLTAIRDSVKRIGADYLVNVSDATAQSYATAIASGEMSEVGVASIMQRQAKSRFTWMSDQIDQGITPSAYFMPIRDTIAQTLEVAPESIDMMNPKWMGVMEQPDEKGGTRAATIREAQLAARRDSGYADTNGAQELGAQAVAAIRDVFGRRPI